MPAFAIVFAGQGSQSVGMMNGFADMPVVKRTFEQASDILKLDLWQMVVEGPAEIQNQTINTQPLMLTAGQACWSMVALHAGILPISTVALPGPGARGAP